MQCARSRDYRSRLTQQHIVHYTICGEFLEWMMYFYSAISMFAHGALQQFTVDFGQTPLSSLQFFWRRFNRCLQFQNLNHNTGNYVPYSLWYVCGFFNVPYYGLKPYFNLRTTRTKSRFKQKTDRKTTKLNKKQQRHSARINNPSDQGYHSHKRANAKCYRYSKRPDNTTSSTHPRRYRVTENISYTRLEK